MDLKFDNLMAEAMVAYDEKNYIRAWTLVSSAQIIIGEKQEWEDRTNGRAAANRVD